MENDEIPIELVDWDSMKIDAERRLSPRHSTSFFAVQRRGADEYYRLVTNLSLEGFFFEDRVPAEHVGEIVVMDFPLPDESETVRVTGRVRYVGMGIGVGVEITNVKKDAFLKMLAIAPAVTVDSKKRKG